MIASKYSGSYFSLFCTLKQDLENKTCKKPLITYQSFFWLINNYDLNCFEVQRFLNIFELCSVYFLSEERPRLVFLNP